MASGDVLYSARLVERRREVRRAKVLRARRIAVVLLTIATLAYGGWAIAHSRLFALDGIEIKGAVHLSRAEVLTAARLRIGMNVLSLDPESISSRLATLPRVDHAEVERLYPSRLRIVITERRPAAVLLGPAGAWLLDPELVVMAQAHDALPAGVPVIRVPGAFGIELGARVGVAGVADALTVWRSVPTLLRPRITALDATDPSGIVLQLADVKVSIGHARDVESKMLALVQILEHRGTRRVISVDLRAPGRPAARYA